MFDAIGLNHYGNPEPIQVEIEARPLWPETFIDWLEPRLTREMNVFEWGSGSGSLWLARRVKSLVSVEHHVLWKQAMRTILPVNARLAYIPLTRIEKYPKVIDSFTRQFDIIIIDGMRREECIHRAVDHILPDGLLVLDNSECGPLEAQLWLEHHGWNSMTFRGVYSWAKADTSAHETRVFWKNQLLAPASDSGISTGFSETSPPSISIASDVSSDTYRSR